MHDGNHIDAIGLAYARVNGEIAKVDSWFAKATGTKLAFDMLTPRKYVVKIEGTFPAQDTVICLTTDAYNNLFDDSGSVIVYKNKGVRLSIPYRRKNIFGKIEEKIATIPATAIKQNSGKAFPDGRLDDNSFVSTVILSSRLKDKICAYFSQESVAQIDTPEDKKIITMSMCAEEPSIWLGLLRKHPIQDVNIGFIFAYISLGVSFISAIIDIAWSIFHCNERIQYFLHIANP